MDNPALPAQIDAANAYEHIFVPALFGEWAAPVVDAAQVRPGQRVLDVACGTGVLAREAAKRAGSVAGLDLNPGMLAVAARLAPSIEWRQGSAESLPWPDQSFNAVLSQFGLMFFTDRNRAMREMRRVLVPGGRMAVAVWDSLENTPAYAAEVALLERIAGTRAADALRAPFVLGNPAELTALFGGAGVASVSIATRRGTARFPDVRSMVEADLRGWLPIMGVVLTETRIGQILEEGERVLAPYVTPEGAVVFESSAHIVTGINP